MIASATLATITIAVAAESPPMKANIASQSWPKRSGIETT